MEVIDAKELNARLTRGDKFSLVMFMDKNAYDLGHIAGSIQCGDAAEAARTFAKDTPIVGYCTTDACWMSKRACKALEELGFTHITHFEGGLWAWENAGFTLEKKSP